MTAQTSVALESSILDLIGEYDTHRSRNEREAAQEKRSTICALRRQLPALPIKNRAKK